MTIEKHIALNLLVICTFSHHDNTLYMDDALDTFYYLFSELSEWDKVEQELIILLGIDYAEIMFEARKPPMI